ncbi:hypothetical protein HGRIS_012100 [Hohenbuehelia grisea]|uniref:Uncharacterized protein n=1 Tax=Hohenbuehelia grisea TaxID=104357 RepID=A0ABR3IR88_9AGAR
MVSAAEVQRGNGELPFVSSIIDTEALWDNPLIGKFSTADAPQPTPDNLRQRRAEANIPAGRDV